MPSFPSLPHSIRRSPAGSLFRTQPQSTQLSLSTATSLIKATSISCLGCHHNFLTSCYIPTLIPLQAILHTAAGGLLKMVSEIFSVKNLVGNCMKEPSSYNIKGLYTMFKFSLTIRFLPQFLHSSRYPLQM